METERRTEAIPVESRVGIEPPPEAPREPTQPLRADAGTIIDKDGQAHRPIDKARANERELAPLTYRDPVAQAAAELAGTSSPGVVQAPAPVKPAVVAASAKPADPTMPAASNSDSPSRGIPGTAHSPHRAKDPLEVTGGFGGGGGEYFALDGTEVRTCVEQLLDELIQQAENDVRVVALTADTVAEIRIALAVTADTGDQKVDLVGSGGNPDGDLVAAIQAVLDAFHASVVGDLRLGIACSYPQYGVTLTLTVKAHAEDPGFTLSKHRREEDEHGITETPPDALRQELGLPIPGKQTTHYAGPLGAISSDVRV